jgi:hypothetical protein
VRTGRKYEPTDDIPASPWERFNYVIPKDECKRRIEAMNKDRSTPWTYPRMDKYIQQICKMDFSTWVRSVQGVIPMSNRTQTVLSKFLQDVESGKLKVYYADPTAVRYKWGEKHPNLEGKPPEGTPKDSPEWLAYLARVKEARKIRAHKNKITVERSPIPVAPTVKKQLQVSIGSKTGLKLTPTQKNVSSPDMPSFADAVRLK